jgi:hypothetical protein
LAVSALSLIDSQVRELRGPRRPHAEVPGDDPAVTLAIIEDCRRLLSRDDLLGVAFEENDEVALFLAYRLAYQLYPVRVTSQSYVDALRQAVAQLEEKHSTHVLAIGPEEGTLPGCVVLRRFGPRARLCRTARGTR